GGWPPAGRAARQPARRRRHLACWRGRRRCGAVPASDNRVQGRPYHAGRRGGRLRPEGGPVSDSDARLLRALATWVEEAAGAPELAELSPWSREAFILRRLASAPNPGLSPATSLAMGLDLLAELRARSGPTRLAAFSGR